MTTTSLKLPAELKQRAAAIAQRAGITPHAFMVGAIEQAASAAEQRTAFVESALAARDEMRRTGKGYDAEEVHAYVKARIAGTKPAKPKARSWRA